MLQRIGWLGAQGALSVGMVTAAMVAAWALPATADPRPVVRGPSDLPAIIFYLPAPPSEAFMSDDFMRVTAPGLRAEAERERTTFDIADPEVAAALRRGLIAIALLQGRPSDAKNLIAEARRVAIKPQLKSVALLSSEALATAAEGGCLAGAARLRQTLAAADAAVSRDEALGQRTAMEESSAALFGSVLASDVDPSAKARSGVTLLQGLRLAGARVSSTLLPPCRPALSAAIADWAADPAHRPVDIWRDREPDTALLRTASPVVVAVWDSGFDSTLFPGQLARDPAEPVNGRDDDGDGVVDDVNGPTFGWRLEPTISPLPPLSPPLAEQLAFQMTLHKGLADLSAGDDTPEARFYAQHSREASRADQKLDALVWEEVGVRSHGTAVASEIADGAPFIRLYNVAALPFGHDPEPVPLDEAQIGRWLKVIETVGHRMRGAGVRVVNLSWGLSTEEIAESLLSVGGETDAARAKARAVALHANADAALRRVIAESPGILFVAGAGNSDVPEEILGFTPQTIRAPNLVVVGGAGLNGRPTSFTTFGGGVRLYAQAQAVPLRYPGGMRTRGTGTSMAAPLVARAAAQMLAINPKLTSAQLVQGLLTTATDGAGGLRLLHTAAAVRWAGTQQ